jgi:hypothetical protein
MIRAVRLLLFIRFIRSLPRCPSAPWVCLLIFLFHLPRQLRTANLELAPGGWLLSAETRLLIGSSGADEAVEAEGSVADQDRAHGAGGIKIRAIDED